jgi:hypothetical protein
LFQHIATTTCNCGNVISKKSNNTVFISCFLSNKKTTKFAELFEKNIHDILCIKCQGNKSEVNDFYVFPTECKFVLIRLSLSILINNNQLKRLNTKITDFDPDYIIISKQKFKTIAAVVQDEISEKSGHFVCYVKNEKNWLLISDEQH